MDQNADRAAMLAHGDAVWEQLSRALDARPEVVLHGPPNPPWTSREIYAHLGRWTAHTVEVVSCLRAGEAAPVIEGDDDAINARWAAEDTSLTTADARARCVAGREALLALLRQLSDEEWGRFGRRCAEDVDGSHYQAHLDAIIG